MRRGRWLATSCLVALVGVAWSGVPGTRAEGQTGPSAGPDLAAGLTPVLSARRLPGWVETTVANQRLDQALAGVAGSQLDGRGQPVGCVLAVQGDRTLFGLDSGGAYLPASNMKLLTAMAALDRLGPSDRLTTEVRAEEAPEDGVEYGNLYLVGGGDPLLRTASFASSLDPKQPLYTSLNQLAAEVRAAGIRVVTGSVVGDDSRYDGQREVESWNPVYVTEGDVAPLSALEVDDDTPPYQPPPKKPPSTAETTHPTTPPTTVPPPPPPDPPLNSASIFRQLLVADGVRVGGSAFGTTPPGAVPVASIQSPDLSQEVEAMLTVSDDTAAELLTKELGYRVSHYGSTEAGTAAIRADLASHQIDVSHLVNLDGSGLDRGDRASCQLLVSVLDRAGPNGILAQGLPVAGQTGTLIGRFTGSPAAGRLRAKTGTLADVAALSGFITPDPKLKTGPTLSQPLTFSILVNGESYVTGQDLIDQIALVLATYPEVPPIASVEPIGPSGGRPR